MTVPLALTGREFSEMMKVVTRFLARYLDRVPEMPAPLPGDVAEFLADPEARRPPSEQGGRLPS